MKWTCLASCLGVFIFSTACTGTPPGQTLHAQLGSYNTIRHQLRIIPNHYYDSETIPGPDAGTFIATFETYRGTQTLRIVVGEDDEPARLIIDGQESLSLVSEPGVTRTPEDGAETTYSYWIFMQGLEVDGIAIYVSKFTRGYGLEGQIGGNSLSLYPAPTYTPIQLNGTTYHLALFDGDDDGLVNSSADRWLLFDTPTLERFNRRLSSGYLYPFDEHGMTRADHPVYLSTDRAAYLVDANMHHATLSIREPDRPLQDYLHELVSEHHRERFESMLARVDRDSEIYVAEFAPEPGRTRSQASIDWHYAYELGPMLERAEQEGKPLFVDFVSFGCGWCSVLDQVAFRDAEVVAFINEHYIPVRRVGHLVAHFRPERYKINASPTLMLIRPDGSVVGRVVGSMQPSAYMAELNRLQSRWLADRAE